MKTDIHPDFYNSTVTCSCGNVFNTGATKPTLRIEVCSKCHPFYTGKLKYVDSAGRIEKFKKKFAGTYASLKRGGKPAEEAPAAETTAEPAAQEAES